MFAGLNWYIREYASSIASSKERYVFSCFTSFLLSTPVFSPINSIPNSSFHNPILPVFGKHYYSLHHLTPKMALLLAQNVFATWRQEQKTKWVKSCDSQHQDSPVLPYGIHTPVCKYLPTLQEVMVMPLLWLDYKGSMASGSLSSLTLGKAKSWVAPWKAARRTWRLLPRVTEWPWKQILQSQTTAWENLMRSWARITLLSHSQIPDPQKLCKIKNVCCFKLSLGIIHYTANDN